MITFLCECLWFETWHNNLVNQFESITYIHSIPQCFYIEDIIESWNIAPHTDQRISSTTDQDVSCYNSQAARIPPSQTWDTCSRVYHTEHMVHSTAHASSHALCISRDVVCWLIAKEPETGMFHEAMKAPKSAKGCCVFKVIWPFYNWATMLIWGWQIVKTSLFHYQFSNWLYSG